MTREQAEQIAALSLAMLPDDDARASASALAEAFAEIAEQADDAVLWCACQQLQCQRVIREIDAADAPTDRIEIEQAGLSIDDLTKDD